MAGFLLALRLVPGDDLVAGELERGPQVGIDARRARPPTPAGPTRSVVDADAVEPLGELAERGVAAGPHRRR